MGERQAIHREQRKNVTGERCYAGFWIRLGAMLIDIFVFFVALVVIVLVIDIIVIGMGGDSVAARLANMEEEPLWMRMLEIVVSALYSIFFLASSWQATLGMRAVGIYVIHVGPVNRDMTPGYEVTQEQAEAISFGRALARELAHWLSFVVLCIGFIMIAFHPQKASLHDLMVRTRVIYGKAPRAQNKQ